ncbi:MAG: RNA polymerase subunit sigma-24 [Cytophagaceae bacterium SCN 52-12]|nr:MAG: RNA polymerase subunit sigma-24 [Cytophagaceae bacterium SCN 52-12]
MKLFATGPTDLEIVEGIAPSSPRKRFFEDKLYNRYDYLIKEGVFKHRLTEDESSIAYSDSVLSVIENIENGTFEGRSSLKTYMHRIFSNKCVDQVRKNTTNRAQVNLGGSVDEHLYRLQDDTRSVIEELMEQHDIGLLWKCLEELGEKCRQMIRSWSEGIADRQIALELGYQSAEVVKTSRLRCLEKLRSNFLQRLN